MLQKLKRLAQMVALACRGAACTAFAVVAVAAGVVVASPAAAQVAQAARAVDAAAAASASASASASQPAAALSAAAAAPVPVETFFRNPDLADATLSPSGNWLAVKMAGKGGRFAVAVFDVNGKTPPQLVVNFSDTDVRNVHWVNDDRLVFDTVDLERGSGDALYWPGLFSVRRDGTELRQLVQMRHAVVTVVSAPSMPRALDPWHVLLHVPTAKVPGGEGDDDVIVGEYQRTGSSFSGALLPKRLNTATGRVTTIARGVPRDVHTWLFDASGAPRLAVGADDGRDTVYWRANPAGTDRSDWTVLATAGSLKLPWAPRHVDAGGRLYVSVANGAAGEHDLRRFDFGTGRPESEPMVRTPGFDFVGEVLSDSEDGRRLGVRAITDAETTVWLDPRLKQLQAEIDRRLPGSVNRLSCRRCQGPDMTVLVDSWSDQDPGAYWIWRGEPGAPTLWQLVGWRRKDVEPARMASVELQRIEARDGRDVPVWVTTPAAAKPGQRLPTVVMPHGGPWVRGGNWNWSPMAQFLASRGYLVVEPEFRGSLGYGAAHFRAGWKQWGQAMQDDVSDALRWAADKGLADASRACIIGASYGGYAALMGVVRDPQQYRCAAAWIAVAEPALLLKTGWTVSDDISDDVKRYQLTQLIGDPTLPADAAMLRDVSPVQQAARIRVPVLLAYGEVDRRVPLEHGERMRAALRAAGQEPHWVVYPGEGHGWQLPATRTDFARRLERFLADNLR